MTREWKDNNSEFRYWLSSILIDDGAMKGAINPRSKTSINQIGCSWLPLLMLKWRDRRDEKSVKNLREYKSSWLCLRQIHSTSSTEFWVFSSPFSHSSLARLQSTRKLLSHFINNARERLHFLTLWLNYFTISLFSSFSRELSPHTTHRLIVHGGNFPRWTEEWSGEVELARSKNYSMKFLN